jgi:hypothetical protein
MRILLALLWRVGSNPCLRYGRGNCSDGDCLADGTGSFSSCGGDIRLPTGTLLGQQTYTWVPLVRNRMGAYRSVPRASNRIAKLWEMDRRSFLYCNACRYVDRTFHGATPRQSECSRLNQDS